MKRFIGLLLSVCMLVTMLTFSAFAEGEPEVQVETKPFNGVMVDFDNASDDELAEAIVRIKAEQRARLVTKITFDQEKLLVKKGASVKVTATLTDVPEELKAGQMKWDTSDKAIATVSNGSVRGVAPGEAIITCVNVLSDGTEISNEIPVIVYVPVSSVTAKVKTIDLGADCELQTEFTVSPADASNPKLNYVSSDESVVTVDENGVLFGEGIGTATVTAMTTDGTEKSVAVTVKVTKKDDRGVTKTNDKGISITLTGIRSSKGRSIFKPAGDNIFVFPTFEIVNGSDDSLDIDMYDFSKECDGIRVDYSFDAACLENKSLSGQIYPGKKLKGETSLEVPNDWKELEVTIDLGWFDSLTFVIYNQ